MNSVAITGISGFIGSRLLSRLEGMEGVDRIVGIDVRPPPNSPPKLKFYCQDILQPLGDIFVDNEVDCAIHLVFVLRPTHDSARAWRIDIGGTINFVEACRRAQVKHILYLSSHTVYGAHPDNALPLKEDSPLHPLPGFQYSWDKVEAERILQDFAASQRDVGLTILRSCPVLGPHAAHSVITSMFKPIMIGIAGYDPLLQFVHEDDLAEVIAVLLEQKRTGIFNVAADGEVRYSEVARLSRRRMWMLPQTPLRLLLGFTWALRLQNESPPSGLEFIKYPPLVSTEKLKRETGFRFKYTSPEAIMSFISASGVT